MSQVDKNITNIDLSNFSPEWRHLNSISVTQNDEIQFVNSLNSWDLSYSKTNPLLAYNYNNGVLVNYYTIRDSKEICPIGFRIPFVSDFNELLKRHSFTFHKNPSNPDDFVLRGNQSILRGSEENDGIYSYLDDDNKVRYWVLDDYSNSELGKAITFTRNANSYYPVFNDNKPFNISVLDKKCGLNLFCIESIDHIVRDTELTYNDLVPTEYDKIVLQLTHFLTYSKTEYFKFTATLRFNTDGINVSDNFSKLDKNSNSALYNSIKNTISNWSVYPYYNDLKVKCHQTFDITHQLVSKTQNGKKRFSNSLRFQNNYLEKSLEVDIYNCDRGKKDFRFTTEIKTTKTVINNDVISLKETETINKFIGKGPIYALYSFLPGLGMREITKYSQRALNLEKSILNSNPSTYAKKLNFLIGTSISLGVIGGSAKLVSNYYYNQYKRENFNSDPNNSFKIANISQKIFLSCLFSYGALFVWDFSSTFTLGIGNKLLQGKVNKKISKLENPIIVN
jgi:hypothetical protein